MEEKNTQNSIHKKTIYDAGYGEIFWKNFLAGLGHALGALMVNILLYIVVGFLFVRFMLPYLNPLISGIAQLTKSVESLSSIQSGSGITLPKNINLQKLLGQ